MAMMSYETVWKLPRRKPPRRRWANPGEIHFDILALGGIVLPHRVAQYLGRGRELVEWEIPEGAQEVVRVEYWRSENGSTNVVRVYRCRVEKRGSRAELWCTPIHSEYLPKREVPSLQYLEELAKKASLLETAL